MISRHAALREPLGTEGSVRVSPHDGSVASPRYALLPGDLRDAASLPALLSSSGLRRDTPTLVLLECVLSYLEPAEGDALFAWAASSFDASVVVVYDPIRPDTPFGQQMMRNVGARGCPLRGVAAAPTPEAAAARLAAAGWRRTEAADMGAAYERLVPAGERARAEAVEGLDEVEEWRLIQAHYALSLGVNDDGAHPILDGIGLK